MKAKNRIDDIKNSLQDNLEVIEHYLNNDTNEMKLITELLVNISVEPNYFLPEKFAEGFKTGCGFVNLLDEIKNGLHHYDGSYVSFVIVNNIPRIVFENPSNEFYSDQIKEDIKNLIDLDDDIDFDRKNIVIEYLDQNVEEFVKKTKENVIKLLKESFVVTSAFKGINYAVKFFEENYTEFNHEWASEENLINDICEKKDSFNKMGLYTHEEIF